MAPQVIKATLGAERRCLALERTTLTYDRLGTALAAVFHTPVAVRYLDGDGDDIGIASDIELDAALLMCGALLRLTLEKVVRRVVKDEVVKIEDVIEICEEAPLESARAQGGGSLERGGGVHARGLKRLSGAVEGLGEALVHGRGFGRVVEVRVEAARVQCGDKGDGDERAAASYQDLPRDEAAAKHRRLGGAEEDDIWRRGIRGTGQGASASRLVDRNEAVAENVASQRAGHLEGCRSREPTEGRRGPNDAVGSFCGSVVPPTSLPLPDRMRSIFPPEKTACDGDDDDDDDDEVGGGLRYAGGGSGGGGTRSCPRSNSGGTGIGGGSRQYRIASNVISQGLGRIPRAPAVRSRFVERMESLDIFVLHNVSYRSVDEFRAALKAGRIDFVEARLDSAFCAGLAGGASGFRPVGRQGILTLHASDSTSRAAIARLPFALPGRENSSVYEALELNIFGGFTLKIVPKDEDSRLSRDWVKRQFPPHAVRDVRRCGPNGQRGRFQTFFFVDMASVAHAVSALARAPMCFSLMQGANFSKFKALSRLGDHGEASVAASRVDSGSDAAPKANVFPPRREIIGPRSEMLESRRSGAADRRYSPSSRSIGGGKKPEEEKPTAAGQLEAARERSSAQRVIEPDAETLACASPLPAGGERKLDVVMAEEMVSCETKVKAEAEVVEAKSAPVSETEPELVSKSASKPPPKLAVGPAASGSAPMAATISTYESASATGATASLPAPPTSGADGDVKMSEQSDASPKIRAEATTLDLSFDGAKQTQEIAIEPSVVKKEKASVEPRTAATMETASARPPPGPPAEFLVLRTPAIRNPPHAPREWPAMGGHSPAPRRGGYRIEFPGQNPRNRNDDDRINDMRETFGAICEGMGPEKSAFIAVNLPFLDSDLTVAGIESREIALKEFLSHTYSSSVVLRVKLLDWRSSTALVIFGTVPSPVDVNVLALQGVEFHDRNIRLLRFGEHARFGFKNFPMTDAEAKEMLFLSSSHASNAETLFLSNVCWEVGGGMFSLLMLCAMSGRVVNNKTCDYDFRAFLRNRPSRPGAARGFGFCKPFITKYVLVRNLPRGIHISALVQQLKSGAGVQAWIDVTRGPALDTAVLTARSDRIYNLLLSQNGTTISSQDGDCSEIEVVPGEMEEGLALGHIRRTLR